MVNAYCKCLIRTKFFAYFTQIIFVVFKNCECPNKVWPIYLFKFYTKKKT